MLGILDQGYCGSRDIFVVKEKHGRAQDEDEVEQEPITRINVKREMVIPFFENNLSQPIIILKIFSYMKREVGVYILSIKMFGLLYTNPGD